MLPNLGFALSCLMKGGENRCGGHEQDAKDFVEHAHLLLGFQIT